jgi:hypothetical protein
MTTDQSIHAPEQEQKHAGRRWPWIFGIVAALLVGIGIGAIGAGDETEPDAATTADNSAEIQALRDQIADLEAERDEALDALAELSIEEEPAEEPVPNEASEAGTRENPLPVRTVANVGPDYELAVTDVNLDANEEVLAVEFNEPSEVGTYVLVTVEGVFLGSDNDEGNPGWDLAVVIIGSDNRQYKDSDTFAVAPDALIDSPTLVAGGEFKGNFVLSVPEEALAGASLFVEPLVSFDGERVFWELGE